MPIIEPTKGGAEPGIYRTVLKTISEQATKTDGTPFQGGPQFRLEFVVLDMQLRETEEKIFGYCSQRWSPKAKFYEWSSAIMLRAKVKPNPNEPFDYDVLIGKRCDVVVEEVASMMTPGVLVRKITRIGPLNSLYHDNDEVDESA